FLRGAGAARSKPILRTALAAMTGAATILLDPIFQGLAISLLFGLASSTLLTVLVIPAIYVALSDADKVGEKQQARADVAGAYVFCCAATRSAARSRRGTPHEAHPFRQAGAARRA